MLDFDDFLIENMKLEELLEFKMMSGKQIGGWLVLGVASAVIYDGIKKLLNVIKTRDKRLSDLKKTLSETPKDQESKRIRLQTKINNLESKIIKDKKKLAISKEKLKIARAKDKATATKK